MSVSIGKSVTVAGRKARYKELRLPTVTRNYGRGRVNGQIRPITSQGPTASNDTKFHPISVLGRACTKLRAEHMRGSARASGSQRLSRRAIWLRNGGATSREVDQQQNLTRGAILLDLSHMHMPPDMREHASCVVPQ